MEAPPLVGLKLNTNKAGMEKVDKEKINQIIMEASKNSKFYENEVRKSAEIAEQVSQLVNNRKSISQSDLLFAAKEVERQLELIEAERDLSHYVVHVDMDAFYAAVEERDDPKLKNIAVAVGSDSMLSTSNYIARQYGVRAAMPGFIAKKLCPHLKIIAPNFDKYQFASSQVQQVFRLYDPNFRMMSLDEAYLDLTIHMTQRQTSHPTSRTFNILIPKDGESVLVEQQTTFGTDIESAVNEIRSRVFTLTKLTCSGGIAANCLLAKICSDKNKPNGQFYLPNERDQIVEFMHSLPTRSVAGIGKVTESLLKGLGIETCGHLFEKKNELLFLFPKGSFQYFLRISLGVGAIPDPENDAKESRKSMSCERTFKALSERDELLNLMQSLSNELSTDLTKAKLYGQNLTVKLKLSSFQVKTRAIMLPHALHDSETIYKYGCKILDKFLTEMKQQGEDVSIRLMGLRMAKFGRKGTVASGLKKGLPKNTMSLSSMIQRSNQPIQNDSPKSYQKSQVESSVMMENGKIPFVNLSEEAGESSYADGLHNRGVDSSQTVFSNSLCLFDDASFDDENLSEQQLENDEVGLDTERKRYKDVKKENMGRCSTSKSCSTRFNLNSNHDEINNLHLGAIEVTAATDKSNSCAVRSKGVGTYAAFEAVAKDKVSSKNDQIVPDAATTVNRFVHCPICGQPIDESENINAHVDNCLAVVEVRNVLKQQASSHNNSNKDEKTVSSIRGSKNNYKRQRNEDAYNVRLPKDSSSKQRHSTKRQRHELVSSTVMTKPDQQSCLSTFLNRN